MNKKISLSLITALSLTTLNAVEFKPVGFKATGMGGTGVASTRGSIAGYYNPALLKFSDYTTEISLGATSRVRESNLIDNMDKLSDLDFDGVLERIADNADNGKVELTATYSGGTLSLSDAGTISLDATTQAALDLAIANNQSLPATTLPSGETVSMDANGNVTVIDDGGARNTTDKEKLKDAINIITKDIGEDNGFMFSVTPSFAAQISDAFALGMYGNVDVGFRINIDKQYNKLITKETKNNTDVYYEYDYNTDTYKASTDASAKWDYENESLEYANDNGINYIEVNSMALGELPISYARAYDFNSGSYSFGINIKPMSLTTYSHKIKLGESSDDAGDNLDDYETTYSSAIGLDIGLAYRPTNSKITFGFMGKNLNSPTFKIDESKTGITEDYEIEPMARIGLSVPVWNDNIEFALDADLTKNKTLVEDEESQYIGAGLEFHPASWFALRLGAMQDIAAQKFEDGTIMTAGLGFGLKWLQVDLSLMASTQQGEYDGSSIPRYVAGNLSLVSKWGDGYNRKQAPVEDNQIEQKIQQSIDPEERNRIKQDSQKAFDELDRSM